MEMNGEKKTLYEALMELESESVRMRLVEINEDLKELGLPETRVSNVDVSKLQKKVVLSYRKGNSVLDEAIKGKREIRESLGDFYDDYWGDDPNGKKKIGSKSYFKRVKDLGNLIEEFEDPRVEKVTYLGFSSLGAIAGAGFAFVVGNAIGNPESIATAGTIGGVIGGLVGFGASTWMEYGNWDDLYGLGCDSARYLDDQLEKLTSRGEIK